MLEAINRLSPEMASTSLLFVFHGNHCFQADDLDGFKLTDNQHGGAEDYPELQISGVPGNEELDGMIRALVSHTPDTESDVLTIDYLGQPNNIAVSRGARGWSCSYLDDKKLESHSHVNDFSIGSITVRMPRFTADSPKFFSGRRIYRGPIWLANNANGDGLFIIYPGPPEPDSRMPVDAETVCSEEKAFAALLGNPHSTKKFSNSKVTKLKKFWTNGNG
ncbi:hypothetical protein PM082_010120 [Marasmius tenuissimus]|nr:hypothetical protein PM082_010120 [Marasmius tenuissimus]